MVFAAASFLHASRFQTFVLNVSPDGLQLRIRRFVHLQWTAAYRLEALDKLHPVDRTRAREKRVITRASCEVAFASVAGWSRSWCQNACAQQPERARSE